MPLASFEAEGGRTLAYALAATFWLGLIMGMAFQAPVSKRRKSDAKYPQARKRKLPRFFSNRPAAVFDTALIAGMIALALSFAIGAYPQWLTTAAIFTSVFSLEMRCIFNGRNYEYLRRNVNSAQK